MNNKNEAIDYYKSNYEKIKNRLPFDLSLREEAVESLLSNGFPTLKDEEWRYTNVAPVLKERFEVPELTADIENSHIEEKFLTGFDFDKLVFIDGQFSPELSDDLTLPEGAVIGSLKNLYEAEKEKIAGTGARCRIVRVDNGDSNATSARDPDAGNPRPARLRRIQARDRV